MGCEPGCGSGTESAAGASATVAGFFPLDADLVSAFLGAGFDDFAIVASQSFARRASTDDSAVVLTRHATVPQCRNWSKALGMPQAYNYIGRNKRLSQVAT